jgi:hypothetical protein
MGYTTTSETKDTALSKAQTDILKSREDIFQNFYLPEFKNYYNSISPDSEAGKAQMGLTANQINASFDSAQKQSEQSMAQRNISDSGAGAAITAANNRARSSALANAYASMQATADEKKANALANFGSMMPSPTTAAPMAQTGYGSLLGRLL